MRKSRCPRCARETTCEIRCEFKHAWDDDVYPVHGCDRYYVLQCCGCELVFFEVSQWCSEDVDIVLNPMTGREELDTFPTIRTFSTLSVERPPQGWEDMVNRLQAVDVQLGRIMEETYGAQHAGLLILASVGLRTAFDRSTELLKVDPGHTLEEKVTALLAKGAIGDDEAELLRVVVGAGNAAAHRGWTPTPVDFQVLLGALEDFLRRKVLGTDTAIRTIAESLPPRPPRPKKG